MGFDADAFLAAREPWTLTIKGRRYTAAPVSVLHVLDFQRALDLAGADLSKQRTALAILLRRMFPPRWAYVWRDPARLVLALDGAAQGEVLRDFFAYLARTLGVSEGGMMTTPPSPPLSAPTPPPAPSDTGA